MTVKELRELLSKYDDDLDVGMSHDAGFCTAPVEESMMVLKKKEDCTEDGWEKRFGWITKGDRILVIDEDECDDEEDDDDDEPWEVCKCRR